MTLFESRESSGTVHVDALKKFKRAVNKATKLMEEAGFMKESEGHFWGVIETRPYMRLNREYLQALLDCGMYAAAVTE